MKLNLDPKFQGYFRFTNVVLFGLFCLGSQQIAFAADAGTVYSPSEEIEGLYDQPLLTELKSQTMGSLQLDELLVEDFLKKKYSTAPYQKVCGSAKYATGFTTLLTGGYAFARYRQSISSRYFAAFAGVGALFAGINAYRCYMSYSEFKDQAPDPLLDWEIEYVRNKRYLPTKIREFIEQNFRVGRADPSNVHVVENSVAIALGLPRDLVHIEYDAKRVAELFEGYPEKLKRRVESFVYEQILLEDTTDRQSTPDVQNYREGKRVVGYLFGAPGTGKSRYAEAIAAALNVPFARLNLEGATIGGLVGSTTSPGKIVEALSHAKLNGKSAKNAVLFVDEADRIINSEDPQGNEVLVFLLQLLDPEFKKFHSAYLGVDIDISHLTIILAGNHRIKDSALRRRLFLMDFPAFPMDQKRTIIIESTIPRFIESHSKNALYPLTADDLKSEDLARIHHFIDIDLDPGFRTIEQVLGHYLSFVARRKYFNQDMTEPAFLEKIILRSNKQLREDSKNAQAK